MSDHYKATAGEYKRNLICRACHDAGFTEAQTIEALVKENDRLTALAVEEAIKPKSYAFQAPMTDERVWLECFKTFAAKCADGDFAMTGRRMMARAAEHADDALATFRERFPGEAIGRGRS